MARAPSRSLQRLGWTLGALAMAVAPHATHLPPWVVVVVVAVGLWRLLAERQHWGLPPRSIRFVLTLVGFAGVILSYRTVNGLDAGSALLIVMMAMKLMETRARRDQLVLAFIAYFLVLASFLYNQSIWSVAYLFATVLVITTGLMQIAKGSGPEPIARALRLSGAMLLQAMPVMLVLFFLFPRVPGPFWALPARSGSGVSGLSDRMQPGDITSLGLSDAVAFRVKFSGAIPPPVQRYWRGPVLHDFDGRIWSGAGTRRIGEDIETRGAPVGYRITLQPHNRRWLFALDMPHSWSDGKAYLTYDYQMIAPRPVDRLKSYDVVSYPEYSAGKFLQKRLRNDIPSGHERRNPRARELALRLRRASASEMEFIAKVLQMFREQEFYYTLEPPGLGADSVDDFVFGTRRGFCEHYASAFTYLMRAGGLPARVVTGYQGGELNPFGEYLIVRQSDAHAWSEVWLEGQGWSRVDPTSAVAPERIEQSLADAMPLGEPVPGLFLRNHAWLRHLGLSWDALNALWNEWILGYGPQAQRSLLSRLGIPDADWRKMTLTLSVLLIALLALLSAYLAWQYRPARACEVVRVYDKFCRKLARRKLLRPAHEGPLDFAQRLGSLHPDLAMQAAGITRLYLRLRYEPDPSGADLDRLRRAVRRFRP